MFPMPGAEMTVPDFTLHDQDDAEWTLTDHLDAGVVLVTLRGDW
jgi:peroxiredoxin